MRITDPEHRRHRLHGEPDYNPWVRAKHVPGDTFLFWVPVSGFPMRHDEKGWLHQFLGRLGARLEQVSDLRQEIFLQLKDADQYNDAFRKYALHSVVQLGIGRVADEPFSGLPTKEEVDRIVEIKEPVDYKDWIANYLAWFTQRQPDIQRELFAGYGALMTVFLPPDRTLKIPQVRLTPAMRSALPVLKTFDVDSILASSAAMRDAFQARSKQMFGVGLEETPEYPGIAFVMPLLNTAQFFVADEERRKQWFSLFDVYVNESRSDKGVVLAFEKPDYETVLLSVLEDMTTQGIHYPRQAT